MIAPSLSSLDNTPQTLAQAPVPQEDIDRRQQMLEAWKSYKGEFQRPLKVAQGQTDDNVLSNRCAPIVDKGVSFLFGKVLKIEATDETTDASTEIQDFLDGLWGDDDDRMTLLSKLSTNGAVCGEAFIKIIPAQGQMKYPRLVVMNPQIIRIVTPPDDCDLVLAYIIEYPGSSDLQKKQIIARVDPDGLSEITGDYSYDDTWTISNYVRKASTGRWLRVGEPDAWPYPFAPIFDAQNLPNPNEAWGRPDLTSDLIAMNKILNFVQSNTSRIIKYHGHPKTYATGLSATQINIGIDDLLCLPSPDSKIQNLEMHGNLSDQLAFASILRSDMDEQSRVPAVALGRLNELPRGNISGVALELLFQPLIEKTVIKQRLYGRMIRDVTRAALVIAGLLDIANYEDYKIDLRWQGLLPVDDMAAAQSSLLLKQLGISSSTLIQSLGFNPEDEAEKTAQEQATAQSQQQPMMPAQEQNTQMQQSAGVGQQ